MGVKRWNVAHVDEELVNKTAQTTGLPEIVCEILAARNQDNTAENIEDFVGNTMEMQSPYKLIDMDKAVERIHEAVENHEKIVIYGDYDCDGITATVLLLSYLQSVGADATYYIPDREEEGYGMNKPAIDIIAEQGASLMITVDNGITSHDEIAYAKTKGIDTVVTDHHTPRETVPDGVAVVNPHRKDCPSKFKDYAGVGVVFLLVSALEGARPEELLEYYSDLVAIGTVGDLVPLSADNRIIVKHGIDNLLEIGRPGIKAILDSARITPPFTSESISFGISPRINAAGRVGNTRHAVELLLTDDEANAEELSGQLNEDNLRRRGIEEQVLLETDAYLKENPHLLLERVLIVKGENWHQGVMGIVASRLLDNYGKPTIVFSVSEGTAKGSGRSIEGFSLINAISCNSEHLLHYGGHTLAAGMTIAEKDLEEFGRGIQQHAKENYEIMPVLSYNIDCELRGKELTVENVGHLDIMAPFGAGNQSPVFVLRNLKLTGIFPTADEKHMRLVFGLDGQEINTIFFRMTPLKFHYKIGASLDAVVSVDINLWNNMAQLSIKIKDLRPSVYPEQEALVSFERYQRHKRKEYGGDYTKEDLKPSREELETIYKFIRKQKGYSFGEIALWEDMLDCSIDLARMQVALDIFEEAGLIARENGNILIVEQKQKVNLEKTSTYKELSS